MTTGWFWWYDTSEPMDPEHMNGLASHYKRALQDYLEGAGEVALQKAYELGRQAMADGLGALDLARIYQEALLDVIAVTPEPREDARLINFASMFFSESLAPFEMTHRGFKEALAILSTRTAELEALNKSLGIEITERVRIESELRHSEERYRDLVDNARDVIYTLSTEGTITSLNPVFETITGWKCDEWLGKSFVHLLHPDDLNRGMEIFQSLLQGDTPSAFELRIVSKSGEYLIGEFTTTSLLQGTTIVGILGIARDITERRKAEERLRTSQLQLAEAQQIAHLGNWDWDVKADTLVWSKELFHIYGVDPSTFEPNFQSYVTLIHPEDREEVRKTVEKAMKDGKPFAFFHRIVRPDGAIRIVHGRGLVALDNKGNVIRMFGTGQDVTEAKQAEEALKQLPQRILEAQEVERRRLSRELHDDVCQRLSAMKLTIDVLETDLPRKRNILKKIEATKGQVDQVITDIRRISWNLRPTTLDDLGLVVALRKLCKDLGETHNLKIRFKASRSIPEHFSTQTEIALYRIAQESLANAIKHSEASGIDLDLKRTDEKIVLTVVDNGNGFDASKQRRHGPGHGLGLLSMKERVSLLHGALHISSTPSKGTKITAEFPIMFEYASDKN